MRILIVDDSKSIQKTVSWRLSKRGHEIVAFGNDGEEGVRLYQEHKPDVMLLDITMPNKDGRECLKEILAIDPHAKIIMLSALSVSEVIDQCIKTGAVAYIDKGQIMTGTTLEDTVEKIVTKISA